jgi:hypothetical protein
VKWEVGYKVIENVGMGRKELFFLLQANQYRRKE